MSGAIPAPARRGGPRRRRVCAAIGCAKPRRTRPTRSRGSRPRTCSAAAQRTGSCFSASPPDCPGAALRPPPNPEPWLEAPNLLGGRSAHWILFYDFARDWRGDGIETPAIFQTGAVLGPHRDPSVPADVLELDTEIQVTELQTSYELFNRFPLFVSHRVPALTRVDADGDGRADLVATIGNRLEVHGGTGVGSCGRRAGGGRGRA